MGQRVKAAFATGSVLLWVVLLGSCARQPEASGTSTPASSLAPPPQIARTWPESVATKEELLKLGTFSPRWTKLEHEGIGIAVAVEELPTDSESYINVIGYVHNRHFREWRRFFDVQLRGAGGVEVRHEVQAKRIVVVGTANNDLRDQRLFAFDLRAVHDDR